MAHDVKLGQLIDEHQQRDAIHIAIAPVVAAEKLYPGQDVGFVGNDTTRIGLAKTPIGIVDPFLKQPVQPEQRCWLCLYPQTITSLRHDWTHPAFTPVESNMELSKAWLQDFADSLNLDYMELIEGTKRYLSTGEYIHGGGNLEGVDLPECYWDHFTTVTGIVVKSENRGYFFSCAC